LGDVSERLVPRDLALLAGLVALLGVVAFSPSLRFTFVYDDHWTIEQNRWLHEPLGTVLSALLDGSANARGVPDATRPAMVVSLWVDHQLFGSGPFGYHLHSVLLYGVACGVATLAAFALLGERLPAALAGAFFALAPLHAEVASAVNYREDLISAIGMLLPIAWLFRPSASKDSVRSGLLVAGVALWGLCGKESSIFLLPLVAAIALLRGVDRLWVEARERTLWFIGAAGLLWANWRFALAVGSDGIPRAPYTGPWTRACDTARFVCRVVGAAFVPIRPSPEYANTGAASALWLLGLVGILVVFALAARRASTKPMAIGLAMVVIAPLGASPVFRPINPWADRYAFVAVLGAGLVFGYFAAQWTGTAPVRRRRSLGIVAGLAAGAACISSARVWADDRALWTYAAERAPGSARAWAALSRVERLSGNLDAADRLVERALSIKPGHVPSRVTRVYNLLARGDVVAARAEIARVEQLGGAAHPGIRRARTCAAGGAEEAKRCIRGGG
jgi:hypothetical protein